MRIWIAIMIGIAGSTPAWAQDSQAIEAFRAQAAAAQLPSGTVHNILEAAQRISKEGGPGNQVLLKATEGIAKGVPPGQIESTVRHFENDVRQATHLVNGSLPPNANPQMRHRAIQETTHALRRGVPPERIRSFLSEHAREEHPWRQWHERPQHLEHARPFERPHQFERPMMMRPHGR